MLCRLTLTVTVRMKFRFIDVDIVDSIYGVALFEAIMKSVENGIVEDTILFWRPSKPAVYIGYHQLVHEEVNVDICKKRDIPIVRRILGGGTGYSDRNQIIYNIIFREDNPIIPYGPRNVYRFILKGVVEALYGIGIRNVEIDEERFGVYVNGKKISGSGQLTSNGVVNSGGSFLIDFDFKTMKKILKNPVKNLKGDVENPEDGITYLKREVRDIKMEDAKKALRNGFEKILGRSHDGILSKYEKELADKLMDKYLDEKWIFRADIRNQKRQKRRE